MPDQPARKESYTPEEVTEMLVNVRARVEAVERRNAAMLTAIQRAQQNGDDPVYIAALEEIFRGINTPFQPAPPQAAQAQPSNEETTD